MIKKVVLLMCVFLLLSAVGCDKEGFKEDSGTRGETTKVLPSDSDKITAISEDEKLGIRGQITKISSTDSGKITTILVEGKIEQDTAYDKASVFIGEKTKIYKDDTKEELKISALKEGIKVEILFVGPIRESYPVQADASIIRIIE